MVEYKYDACGRIIGRAGSLVSALVYLNSFRYRGYVYDEETGLYYLQSRFYNPSICRFINADGIIGVSSVLIPHNICSCCSNNQTKRKDAGDTFFIDTVFDIVSLAVSVVDVASTPTDPWAWAGLAGDVVDLIPGVTGVGETVRLANAGKNLKKAGNPPLMVQSSQKMLETQRVFSWF